MMPTKTGEAGRAIVKDFESLSLVAYPDPASPRAVALRSGVAPDKAAKLSGAPWTIGWGHTGPEVHEGLIITSDHAEKLLTQDLFTSESDVRRYVKVQLNQNQFDALVSFTFNLGGGNLASSTLLKKLNAEDYEGASKEFVRWNKAKGKVMAGLTRRRNMEAKLFMQKVA